MKNIFLGFMVVIFCYACNNSGSTSSTADSLKRAPSVDTMRNSDTMSYDRMPNNATGGDSTK